MQVTPAHLCLFLAVVLSAQGGCSNGNSFPEETGGPPVDSQTPEPAAIDDINADDALLLAQSMMDMVGKLAKIGDVATDMVQAGSELLSGPVDGTKAIDSCDSPAETGESVNELKYWVIESGFDLPAGDALTAAFTECTLDDILVVGGFLHITDVSYSGDPSGAGNWDFEATVVMSPFEIFNDNGTLTSYTDSFQYNASRSNGVQTVDIEVSADPDAGLIGGVNAQFLPTPTAVNQDAVNYQFRPFRITTVENDNTGAFTMVVQAHSTDGDSMLERYTVAPSSDIELTIATDDSTPVTWSDGKPDSYEDVPDFGMIEFASGESSVVADVQSDGVVLTVDTGAAVTTESVEWEDMLSAPDP